MTKHLTVIFAIIAAIANPFANVKAQIIITQADMPGTASKAIMAVDTSKSFLPGPASAVGQSWNYSTLANTGTYNYIFKAPSATPYSFAFPSSNIADSLVYAPGYFYFSSTPSSFSEVGFVTTQYGFTAGIRLSPSYVQISLPATYSTFDGGKSRGDTSMAITYSGFDSGRAVVNISYWDTIDAFGKMTTPYGADSVIRQRHYDYTIDSIFVHSTSLKTWIFYPPARTTQNNQYRWYAKGVPYYFALMQLSNKTSTDSVLLWFDGIDVGINEISHSAFTSVYPNPCKTQITFKCSATEAKQVSVFDITGRQISTQEIKNGILNLNTSAYSAGMYFYKISDISGNTLDRGKFMVQ